MPSSTDKVLVYVRGDDARTECRTHDKRPRAVNNAGALYVYEDSHKLTVYAAGEWMEYEAFSHFVDMP